MYLTRSHLGVAPLSVLLFAALAVAQDQPPTAPPDQPPSTGGWRRVGTPPPLPPPAPDQQQQQEPAGPAIRPDNPEPVDRSAAEQAPPPAPAAPAAEPAPASAPQPPRYGSIPPELTVRPGTYISARVNEPLSSDRNRPGDPFTGTLMQPLVVDGVVVAQAGQTVTGRVVDAEKARSNAPSRLALELTGLTLVDGEQVPLRSQVTTQQGPREPGAAQAGTILNSTVMGTIIGSAIGWRPGAAFGAAAGAMTGVGIVMMTRNRPTVIYPETALSFEFAAPLTIYTGRSPQAFHYAGPADYERPAEVQRRPVARNGRCYGCAPAPYPYPYPYPYPPYGYPYPGPYWGPRVGVGVVIGGGRWGRW